MVETHWFGVNSFSRVLIWAFHHTQLCLWRPEACTTAERVCARTHEYRTALWAAIRVQQEAHLCERKENPNSAELVEEGGWRESGGRGAGRFTSRNESEARQTPRQDADLCGLYILRYKQRSGCTGVAGKEIKQGLYCYRGLFTLPSDLRCCSALAHGLVGSHCNCIQWFQDGQWRPSWLKNATYNPMIRKKTMVFFLLSIIGWGAAAIVTLGLGTCTRIKFFFLLQFIDRKAPISSS